MVGRPSRRSSSGRDAVREVQEWSGGPHKVLKVVRRPFWKSGSVREALPMVWEWSGGPPEGTGVVISTSSEVRQWSVGPPGGSGVVGTSCRKFGSG